MPISGRCYKCNRDIVPELINRGEDGKTLVTGCPLCYYSFYHFKYLDGEIKMARENKLKLIASLIEHDIASGSDQLIYQKSAVIPLALAMGI